jgi:hypothetical protein
LPGGAVYKPDDEMVPVVEDPPGILLTSQMGLESGAPFLVAENCKDWLGRSTAEEGVSAGVSEAASAEPRGLVRLPELHPEIRVMRSMRTVENNCRKKRFNS